MSNLAQAQVTAVYSFGAKKSPATVKLTDGDLRLLSFHLGGFYAISKVFAVDELGNIFQYNSYWLPNNDHHNLTLLGDHCWATGTTLMLMTLPT